MLNQKEKAVLDLIALNKSKNEIVSLLNITNQEFYEIFSKFKTLGIDFYRDYYSNGNIKYKKIYDIEPVIIKRKNLKWLHLTEDDNESITMLFLSDPHYGSGFEYKDVMDMAYEYCAKKGIHVVVNTGDNVDGTFSKVQQRITDPYEQLEYFLENYPQDDHIITFTIGGDHDYSLLRKYAINLLEAIENRRHDIVPLAFHEGFIKVKKEKIALRHYFPNLNQYVNIYGFSKENYKFYATGHFHFKQINFNDYQVRLQLSSMSSSNYSNQVYALPKAFAVTFNFNGDYFDHVVIEEVSFDKEVSILGTYKFPLSKDSLQELEISNSEGSQITQEMSEEEGKVILEDDLLKEESGSEDTGIVGTEVLEEGPCDEDIEAQTISLEELEEIKKISNRKILGKYVSSKGNIKKSMPLNEFEELLIKCEYDESEINIFLSSMAEYIKSEQLNLRLKHIISLLDKESDIILQKLLLFQKNSIKDDTVFMTYEELKEFILSSDYDEFDDNDKVEYVKSILNPLVKYFELIEENKENGVVYSKVGYIKDNRGRAYIESDLKEKKHIEITGEFLSNLASGNDLSSNMIPLIGPAGYRTYAKKYKGYYYVYTTVGDSYIMWGTWPATDGYSEYNKRWSREDCTNQLSSYRSLISHGKFIGEDILLPTKKKKKARC